MEQARDLGARGSDRPALRRPPQSRAEPLGQPTAARDRRLVRRSPGWDSDWYLRIAESGYRWPSSTPAFFPLIPRWWPGSAASSVTGSSLRASSLRSAPPRRPSRCCTTSCASDSGRRTHAVRSSTWPCSRPRYSSASSTGEGLFLGLADRHVRASPSGQPRLGRGPARLAALPARRVSRFLPALAPLRLGAERRAARSPRFVVPLALFLVSPSCSRRASATPRLPRRAARLGRPSPARAARRLVQAVGEGDVVGPISFAVGLPRSASFRVARARAPYGVTRSCTRAANGLPLRAARGL